MKKNLIAPFIATICALSITACGNSASTEAPAETEAMTEAETSETSETDAASEEGMTVNLANAWKECTEADALEFAPNLFSAPEGSENIVWSMMENPDTSSEFSFPLVQMAFDYEGNSFTAREWYGVPEDTDISGMYYEWTATEDVTLANWGYGHMPGTTYRFIGDDKYVDLITWHDLETGALYSLSCEAPNLDGFDIQAVAEAMYDESKQESAKIPDDEDSHVPMDITGCDTFTQIVDKLENGMGYANATINGTDVLLVTSYTYDFDGEGKMAAIDADIYCYNADGVPTYCGYAQCGGTSYPLSVAGDLLYVGNGHGMKKMTIVGTVLAVDEQAYVEYDQDGNETYYYTSDLHDVEGTDENGVYPDNEKYTDFFAEFMNAEVIEFNTVSK
ncbi:MAG: hypothetical protein J6O03_03965 [Butyrivibrio sp.]|nr:hypothetical protein [Butyrivibrio sp.]